MAGFRVEGNTSGNVAEVNASNQLKVTMETNAANTTNVGAVRIFNENDPGTAIGTVWISNGISGVTYEINHHISTLGGRTDERTFSVAIVNQ